MKLILLGGVPATGKTTISNYLAIKYGISTVINIDVIKQTLKLFINSNEKYLYTTSHSASEIENLTVIKAYLKHSKVVNKYIKLLLKKIKDKIIIVEGVTVNNNLYKELSKMHKVIYINLYSTKNELLNRYEIKSKLRSSNWVNNIEIINEISEYLLSNSMINILSYDLDQTLKEVYLYVEKFLYD
jgi:2-phosphoglycerate kinase